LTFDICPYYKRKCVGYILSAILYLYEIQSIALLQFVLVLAVTLGL